MSRSGYDYDYDVDQWATIRYGGMLASAIRGRRGQGFLRDLAEAMDAMPEKRLIAHDLIRDEPPPSDLVRWLFAATEEGASSRRYSWDASISIRWPHEGAGVCAIGSLGVRRGVEMATLDPEDAETVGATFDIATPLAREVVFQNDEAGPWKGETPEQRWQRMRKWVSAKIADESSREAA